jgi:hypothetical protein
VYVFPFTFWPIGGIFSLLIPFFLIFIGIRIVRRIFFSASRDIDRPRRRYRPQLPFDDMGTVSSYPSTKLNDIESRIFKLAQGMKGRITLSDIVIATNLNMKEAEQLIDSMIDGIHITMEVNDKGRVMYEFPEIIARFEDK